MAATTAPIAADELPSGTALIAEEQELRQNLLRNPGVRALTSARLTASLGITTLAYGGMVYLATVDAPQIVISVIGATRFFSALIFGIGGGALVAAMSKRTALVTAFALQALACFLVPTLFGTTIPSLLLLVFAVAMLGQIAVPAIKAATAMVSTRAQVAVAAAIVSVAGGIGAALGSAFLAPTLIRTSGLTAIIYVAGFVMVLSALQALRLPKEDESKPLTRAAREIAWRETVPTLRRTVEWLLANRQIGTLLLVGAMVMALFEGLNTLMPVYVRDVLKSDPTNTIYILAPGGIGFMAGTVVGPWLMDRRGERMLAVMAFFTLSLGFILFGVIDLVAPILAPVSPLRFLELFGFELTPQIKAAGLISVFTALGSTSAIAAVQTYINRWVLLTQQPGTFGMQEVIENAMVLVSVLGLGLIATVFGAGIDFILAPILVTGIILLLIRTGFKMTDQAAPGTRAMLRVLFDTTANTEVQEVRTPGPGGPGSSAGPGPKDEPGAR